MWVEAVYESVEEAKTSWDERAEAIGVELAGLED